METGFQTLQKPLNGMMKTKQAAAGHFTCQSDGLRQSKWVILGQNVLQCAPDLMPLIKSHAT